MAEQNWVIQMKRADFNALSEQFHIDPVVARILVNRGVPEDKFAEFLKAFKKDIRNKEVDGKLFDTVDQTGSTKDKAIIIAKLHILETLMNEFLLIKREDLEEVNILDFVKETVNPDVTKVDMRYGTISYRKSFLCRS